MAYVLVNTSRGHVLAPDSDLVLGPGESRKVDALSPDMRSHITAAHLTLWKGKNPPPEPEPATDYRDQYGAVEVSTSAVGIGGTVRNESNEAGAVGDVGGVTVLDTTLPCEGDSSWSASLRPGNAKPKSAKQAIAKPGAMRRRGRPRVNR